MLLSIGLIFSASGVYASSDQYKWSVQYLIDSSQSVFGRPQASSPRGNRGLALSHDGRYLYAGYIHQKVPGKLPNSVRDRGGFDRTTGAFVEFFKPDGKSAPDRNRYCFDGDSDGQGELRKIDTSIADYEEATVAVLPGVCPKAIAVDNEGRVYAAIGDSIVIFDPDLKLELHRLDFSICDGVAVVNSNTGVTVYGTERFKGALRRWEIEIDHGRIKNSRQAGFADGSGVIAIPSKGLRGVTVDPKGRIWIADLDGNKVFRVESNGTDLKSLSVHSPCAIAFDGSKGFVTRWREREVTIIDDEMQVIGTLAVPWDELEIAPLGRHDIGALSGIAVIPGQGFYVSNEWGRTALQRSTYGRIDNSSNVIGGKLFADTKGGDRDPIFRVIATDAPVAATPTPQPNP